MVRVKAVLSFLFIIAFSSQAETGTIWDLDNLQKQRVLYEAKAALNKAKAEAEGKGSVQQITPATAPNGMPLTQAPTISADSLPELVKVNGRKAVLSLSDGNTTTVSSGQMLPGGRWQVVSVSLGGVKIKNIATQKFQVIN